MHHRLVFRNGFQLEGEKAIAMIDRLLPEGEADTAVE